MANFNGSGYIDIPVDLEASLCGGQSFRWEKYNEFFRGVIEENIVKLKQAEKGLYWVACNSNKSLQDIIINYLDLDFDLQQFSDRNKKDDVLQRSLRKYYGLRILNQDPWECLISFICSAASNLNKITKNVQSIIKLGVKIGPDKLDCSFPTPETIVSFGEGKLRELGVGFRSSYVIDAAQKVLEGKIDFESLKSSSFSEAKNTLMIINGVGEKIADCVLAFSLGCPQAFPVDRWVRRGLISNYGCSPKLNNNQLGYWARKKFNNDGSYVQQYLFHMMKNDISIR